MWSNRLFRLKFPLKKKKKNKTLNFRKKALLKYDGAHEEKNNV